MLNPNRQNTTSRTQLDFTFPYFHSSLQNDTIHKEYMTQGVHILLVVLYNSVHDKKFCFGSDTRKYLRQKVSKASSIKIHYIVVHYIWVLF